MIKEMTAQDAIDFVAERDQIPSMYEMANQLCCAYLKVSPTQISNYRNGVKMSKKVAKRFFDVYNVKITDIHSPGTFSGSHICK